MVKGFSIASLVLGILSFVLCCTIWVGGVLAIVSLTLGIIALVHINEYDESDQNVCKGMAIAGVVCSSITIVLIAFCLVFAFSASSLSGIYTDTLYDLNHLFDSLSYTTSL
ncbi:MAG: DUF4190 domain-containing protein [Eubacteriaceae bacterium]|jgi:riboflavin transporter FmnP